MVSVPFNYLMQGDILAALSYIFNNYFPYGLLWIILGGLLFAVEYGKTRSFGISGIVFIIYSVVVGSFIPREFQLYFTLFTGVLIFGLFLKVILSEK